MKEEEEGENHHELEVEKIIWNMKKSKFFIVLYFVLGSSRYMLVMFLARNKGSHAP